MLPPFSRASLAPAAFGLALALGSAPPAAASIVGVCPDGSVFIVQVESAIPCPRAKRVEPTEVPPLRPEYLPKPYTWKVYEDSVSPQNPYNAVDAARKVRALQDGGAVEDPSLLPPMGGPPTAGGAPGPAPSVAAAPPAFSPDRLGLTDGEVRDLFLIVELSQDRTPAAFSKQTSDGLERVRISLAHSASFQERFHASAGGAFAGRQVLLFSAVASASETFFPNFTITQHAVAFQPDHRDAKQLGLLRGRVGDLQEGEAVLGYIIVPDSIDLATPADVYWNDRRTTVTFLSAG